MARPVTKDAPQSIKWACITVHRWLPPAVVQIAGARAWGAHEDWLQGEDISTTYIDDVSKLGRTTRYDDKLPKRAELLHAVSPEDVLPNLVYFREPMCVGFAIGHARDTVLAFWARNALVYVQTLDLLLRAGDDLAPLLAEVDREAKAKRQADWRQRQAKTRRKS